MIGFQQFDYVVFRYGSLGVYLLRFYWRLLHVQINVFISLTRFQPLFKQYYLCYFPLFLFFWDCHYEYVSMLNITPHASEALFILFYFFLFLLLKLDNHNWSIFKFSDAFFCQYKSVLYSHYQIFHFRYFKSRISLMSLFTFSIMFLIPLFGKTLFSYITYWRRFLNSVNRFKITGWKSLSSKSNIWIFSGPVSISCLLT